MIIQCTLVGGFIDALHIRLKKQHGQLVSQAQVEATFNVDFNKHPTCKCLDFMNGIFFFNITL